MCREGVSLNKTADILQATFKHYFEMAMDHHTKATTASNIMLILVAAIITILTRARGETYAAYAIFGSIICLIGIFDMAWVWKQHERYHYWEKIAYGYQEELRTIVPLLKPIWYYKKAAEANSAAMFGTLFVFRDRYLHLFLHLIVLIIGIMMVILPRLIPNFFKISG